MQDLDKTNGTLIVPLGQLMGDLERQVQFRDLVINIMRKRRCCLGSQHTGWQPAAVAGGQAALATTEAPAEQLIKLGAAQRTCRPMSQHWPRARALVLAAGRAGRAGRVNNIACSIGQLEVVSDDHDDHDDARAAQRAFKLPL